MIAYEEYIEKLKNYKLKPDFEKLYSNIEKNITKKNFFSLPGLNFAFAGALAVLFIGVFAYMIYFASPYQANVVDYVFANGNSSDNAVFAYVFSD